MANVPLSKDVPKIYVPSLSVPHIRVPQIYVPQIDVPGKLTYKKPERKHAKDLGDLLLGDFVHGTKQMKHTLQDAGYNEWVNVPILNRLVAFSVMSKERFIDPVMEGKPGVAFINGLETLGGSLDIVANPVKSLMPWAGGGSSTDLLKSMGWIEDEYRETYQWDTGNWLLDLVGEIISDPINWFTFGSGTLMKGSASVTDDVVRNIIKELPEEAVSPRTVTNLVDEFATHVGDDGARIIENYITKQQNQLDDLYKQLNKANITNKKRSQLIQKTTALQNEVDELGYLTDSLTPAQQAALFERFGILGDDQAAQAIEYGYRSMSPKQREQLIQNLVDASQSRGYKAYDFWRSVNKVARGADELLTKAAIYTTLPFGLSKIAYDLMAKPLFKALWNKAVLALEDADLFNSFNINKNTVTRIKETVLRDVKAAYAPKIKDWDELLKRFNFDVDKARKHWLHIYQSMSDTVTDINVINAKFIDDLIAQCPILRYVKDAPEQLAARVLDDVIDPDVANQLAKQLSFEDIVDYCATAGTITHYIDTQAVGVVRDRMAREVKTFWANKKKGYKVIAESVDFADLDPVDIVQYIDQGLLRKTGGLKNLTTWLTGMSNISQKDYQAYLAIMNYVGITLDNHQEVRKLLNKINACKIGSKEHNTAVKQLKTLLTKSKTGDLLILDAVEQNKKQFNKQITKIAKKKTNVADTNEVLEQIAYNKDSGWRYVDTPSPGDIKELEDIPAPKEYEAPAPEIEVPGPDSADKIIKDTSKDYDINVTGLQENMDTFVKLTSPEEYSVDVVQEVKLLQEELKKELKRLRKTKQKDSELRKRLFERIKELESRNSNNILTQLDAEFNYAGTYDYQYDIGVDPDTLDYTPSSYSFSQAIESCRDKAKAFSKELQDETLGNPDVIIEKHADFVNEVRALREAVHKAQYSINKELEENVGKSVKYSVEVRQFINDLDTILSNITDTGITDIGIVDIKTIAQTAADEGTDVMMMQMSKENMVGLIGDLFYTDLIDDELWQALSDPNNPMREHLILLCEHLTKSEDTINYVTDIKEILSTIDNINLYREIIGYSFCSRPDLPTEVLDYIQGEFFNRIFAAAHYKQPQFEKAVSEIMETFRQNLLQQKDFTKWITDTGYDVATTEEIYQDIITTFRFNLDKYIEGLDRIRINNNLPTISLFKNFSNTNLVQRMHNLGWGYEDVMKQLITVDPRLVTTEQQALIDISNFITGGSARVTAQMRDEVNTFIEQTLLDLGIDNASNISNSLIERLRYLHDSALATRLEQIYSDIKKVNRRLQLANGVVGTVDGVLVENVQGLMLKNEVNLALKETSHTTNVYVYSTIGGHAFKTLVTEEQLRASRLAPEFFRSSMANEDYLMFLHHWNRGSTVISNRIFKPDAEYVQQIRDNLIDVYTKISGDPAFDRFVIPKDPRTFFKSLSQEDLLTWDYISRKSSFNSRIASRYTEVKHHRVVATEFNRKAEFRMNPLSVVNEYEETADMVSSAEALTSILVETDLEHLDLQVECISNDYKKQIKDLESLGVHKDMLINLINQDTEAVSQISKLQDLLEDNRTIKEVIDIDKLDDVTKEQLARYFKTETWYNIQMNDKRVLDYIKAEICWDRYENVKRFDAQQLRAYIDNECSGELFIANPNYDTDFDWTTKFTDAELKEAGLKVWRDPEYPSRFIIRRTDNIIHSANYDFKVHQSVFQKQRTKCLRIIKGSQHYYYNDGMHLPYQLYTGDMVTDNAVSTIKKSDRYIEIFGDANEQKLYSNLDDKGINKFFQKNIPRPDAMFIGEPSCYNDFMGTVAEPFKSTENMFIPRTMDLPRSVATGVIQATKLVNTQHKLLSLVANDDFYIGNSVFRPVFEKATDKEIKQFFKDNGFVACVVKQNAAGQPRVYKIYIENQRTLQKAIEAKALILPYEVYRTMVLGINKAQSSNRLINIYTKYVASTYKSIWLSTPGFAMRNALDSMFYKNMASTNGLVGLFDTIKYEVKAAKIMEWYDDIYKKAIDLRKADGGFGTPNMRYIRKVLKEMSEEDKKMFLLMLAFEKSGGSAGLTETVEQAMIKYNRAVARGVDNVDDTIVDLLYRALPTGWINKVNDKIERISRLGLLLNLMDNGMSKADAFKRVIDTHFDYELTEAELGFVGQIFWFITFPIKNSLYYLNEGMWKNPDMLKMQMDAMEQSWNSGDITWDDVRHSNYLMYNAMAGNVRFKFNGKNIVLKTSSSVLDFFNILSNPVGEAVDRLNPFLSVMLGQDEPSQLNPLSSVSNRIDQIRQGRSLLPSVYTTLYDRKKYDNYHYIEKAPFIRNAKWKIKKPRKIYFSKPDNMKRMRYRFSTHRYYFTKGKHLHRYTSSWSSLDPTWYSNNYRYRKLYQKHLREFKPYADTR